MSRNYWLLLILGVLLSSAGGVLLKLGAIGIKYEGSITTILLQLLKSWQIALGLLCYFIPALIWIFMLQKIPLSLLQPLFSLVYIVTPICALIIFNESISSLRWLGISIVLIGTYVIAQS